LLTRAIALHCFTYTTPRDPPYLHSFPTRRSSDLRGVQVPQGVRAGALPQAPGRADATRDAGAASDRPARLPPLLPHGAVGGGSGDRKSTRLNSSHEWISYAVFCLKKKKESTRLNR